MEFWVRVVFVVQPSTSQGAGANVEYTEEELLDYDEEVEAHVASVPKGGMMQTSRVVQKVVQRDHLGGSRQELVVGNLPRGEDLGLVSVELGGGRMGLGDAIQNANKVIRGLAGKERGKGSVDSSIQVGINSDEVSGKSEVRLPQDKVQQLVSMLEEAVRRPMLELRRAQSFLGHLNFACKVVRVVCGYNSGRILAGWERSGGDRVDRRHPISSQLLRALLGVVVEVVSGPGQSLFCVDCGAFVHSLGRDTSIIKAFWSAIRFGWGKEQD
ncbi:hypothetical protein NDU88_001445 [Pleurodeles waltl]|uniref:Uncharacterized protein n=1 Tax=Pleurodeles waltl TaxID=8319 RepID=A0AAV7VWF4_PLEWA|nr:hypothetical protein NDU88_001445 [Pleurodeles waltl]